jgi:hypothetical protein
MNGILHLMDKIKVVVDMYIKKWNPKKKIIDYINQFFNLLLSKNAQIKFEKRVKEFFTFFPAIKNKASILRIGEIREDEIPTLMEWMANISGNAMQKCLKIIFFKEHCEGQFIQQIIEVIRLY